MQKLLSECQESPPSALEIESWLEARTPQKLKYSQGREKYRAALPSETQSHEALPSLPGSPPLPDRASGLDLPAGLDLPVDADLPDDSALHNRLESEDS
jgi:hypothetical protein